MSERMIPREHVGRFSQGILGGLPQRAPEVAPLTAGLSPLGLGGARDGLIWCPTDVDPDRPVPLALVLHGAGGVAAQMMDILLASAPWRRVVLLAPQSRAGTWDVIAGGYGPDVAFISAALAHVAERQQLDRANLAIGGFSDGASYALSVGVINGDLFSHVVAFSPG